MKQLFTYTDLGDKRQYDAKEFVTKELDAETVARLDGFDQRYEELSDKSDAYEKENAKPFMTPFHYLLLALAAAIIGIMIYATRVYGSIEGGFDQNPVLMIVLGVLCLAAVVLFTVDKQKRKKEDDPLFNNPHEKAITELIEEEDTLLNKSFETLGIPSDECELDVITLPDGFAIDSAKTLDTLSLVCFYENGTLSLTDCRTRYDFPREAFTSVERISRPIVLSDWHKWIEHNRKEYKKYGITEKDGCYTVPSYDTFTIEKEGEYYLLSLPVYDGDCLREMLDLPNA